MPGSKATRAQWRAPAEAPVRRTDQRRKRKTLSSTLDKASWQLKSKCDYAAELGMTDLTDGR